MLIIPSEIGMILVGRIMDLNQYLSKMNADAFVIRIRYSLNICVPLLNHKAMSFMGVCLGMHRMQLSVAP